MPTERYIRMCRSAGEIQHELNRLYPSVSEGGELSLYTTWVPTIEDLWRMLGGKCRHSHVQAFANFVERNTVGFFSVEEFLLAFIMEVLYDKKWNDLEEKWEKIEDPYEEIRHRVAWEDGKKWLRSHGYNVEDEGYLIIIKVGRVEFVLRKQKFERVDRLSGEYLFYRLGGSNGIWFCEDGHVDVDGYGE